MQAIANSIAETFEAHPDAFEAVYAKRMASHEAHMWVTQNSMARSACAKLIDSLRVAMEMTRDGKARRLYELKHIVPMSEIAETAAREALITG